MREAQLDVTLEILVADDTAVMGDQEFWRQAMEKMRVKADELCAAAGARLRTDRPPEIISKIASHRLTQGDWVLVASRWWADVPDTFHGDGR